MTTLKTLRQLTGLSAPDLAILKFGHVSRPYAIEDAENLDLRTVYDYVAAIGGHLRLTVELAGQTHTLTQFDALHDGSLVPSYEDNHRRLARRQVLMNHEKAQLRAYSKLLGFLRHVVSRVTVEEECVIDPDA
jgi:hypothetical protein